MENEYRLSYTAVDINTRLGKIDNLAEKSEVPKKLSDLTNDSDFATENYVKNYAQPIGNYALKSEIPTDYLTNIPSEYVTETELNAKGYLTEHQSLEGLATETYVNTQIAAIPTPDVSGQINTHNTATDAHNDIRLLVEDLTTRLNTLANSDDTTLDQMNEVVAYIKNNKTLIDGITTNKINVADIIDNLTTNVTNKPLSAAQGVALKKLIDDIIVPTKVSQLTNDKNYLTSVPSEYITETELNAKNYLTEHQSLAAYAKTADLGALAKKDSLTAADVGALPNTTVIPDALADLTADSTHRLVTDSEKSAWNAKAEVSAIPTKVSQLTNDSKFLTSFTETDPTVPAWAKAATKPSYTKSEIGLGNVDNVKQYSASNPPPYPVTSVNGKTGTVTLDTVLYTAQSLTEFQKAMARQNIGVLNPLIGTTDAITPSQVSAALLEGRAVVVVYTDATFGTLCFNGFVDGLDTGFIASSGVMDNYPAVVKFELSGDKSTDQWTFRMGQLAQMSDIPKTETVPDYVVTEAMEVLDKVVSAQGSRTFVLGAITDMHYGSSDYTDGVLHACQGLKHISERIKLDAIAVLGDYTDEHQMDTDTAVTDLEEMNALLDRFCDTVNLRVKGNHDHRPGAAAQTYRYIFAHNDDVIWGNRIGGYFYRDFHAYKLRIICLNTTEVARDNLSVSDEQYNFFVNALDMSAKDDAEEWGILILSHHPLDWTVTSGAYRFGHILNAYQNGNSWTDGTISCDYSGKNIAKIVGNIHGHIHNLLTDKIYIGEPGNSEQTSVWRIAIPASRVDVVNHYTGVWNENKWYNKTQNTAEDTSFNIICIDLDTYTIKAFCYGAGYDREIAYSEPPIINLINDVGYFDNMRLKSDGSYVEETSYTSSGKIPVSAGDIIRTYGISFDAADYNRCVVHLYVINNTDHSYVVTNSSELPFENEHVIVNIDDSNNLTITFKTEYYYEVAITGYGSGANLIVTKNQVISEGTNPESPEGIINQIPISTDTDGTVYNGKGYANEMRIGSNGAPKDGAGYSCTGFIPFTSPGVIRTSEGMFDTADETGYNRIVMYDSSKTLIDAFKITPTILSNYSTRMTVTNGALWVDFDIAAMISTDYAERTAYLRFTASNIHDGSVITIDQEIV